jgi:hypothetical protein
MRHPERITTGRANGTIVFSILLFSIALSGQAALHPPAFAGDIVCSNGKRFLTPEPCIRACLKEPFGLAHLTGGECHLDPLNAAMRTDPNGTPTFYNQVVFGGVVPEPLVLISYLINHYYPPHLNTDFEPMLIKPLNDAFAEIEYPRSNSEYEKVELEVDPKLYRQRSPAFLLSTMGHEMIHAEQGRRTVRHLYLDVPWSVIQAMREVEAFSWQLNRDNFPRSFLPQTRKLIQFMTQDEKQDLGDYYVCWQWALRVRLNNLQRTPAILRDTQFRLEEDPWFSQVWITKYPNWKSQRAGKVPTVCANLPEASDIVQQ